MHLNINMLTFILLSYIYVSMTILVLQYMYKININYIYYINYFSLHIMTSYLQYNNNK